MKKTIINILFFGITIVCFGQTKQTFTKKFKTNTGIYGTVKVSTQAIAFGAPYADIQADEILVLGIITNNKKFISNELSEYGISFPYKCKRGYFYVRGTGSMLIEQETTRVTGSFTSGGSTHLGGDGLGKTQREVKFSESVKKRHNLAVKAGYGSAWDKNGRIDKITITGVASAEFGKITNAIRKYNLKKQKEAEKKEKIEGSIQQTKSDYINSIIVDSQEGKPAVNSSKNIKSNNSLTNNEGTVNNNIKRPYEYTKEEWEGMSKSEQEASLQYHLDNLGSKTNSTEKPKIDQQLQNEGHKALGDGDYLKAIQSFTSAGDHTSALATGGVALIDLWSKSSKERRKRKISERHKILEQTFKLIEKKRKHSASLFSSNEDEKYFLNELNILDLELEAIFNSLMIYRKSKNIEDKNLMTQLEKDYENKYFFFMKSGLFNDYQKLHLFFSYSYQNDSEDFYKWSNQSLKNLLMNKEKN